jgi:hypothetical protein
MPLSLYLEDLSSEDFRKVYESIMVGEPSSKKTRAKNVNDVVETVMAKLYSKFSHHTAGNLPNVTASSSSTSPV